MVSGSGDSASRDEPAGGRQRPSGRPRPWALAWIAIAALYVGGVAVIGHLWVLFWACAGVVVLSVPAGKVIAIMGETVTAGQARRMRAAVTGGDSAAGPGVRLD